MNDKAKQFKHCARCGEVFYRNPKYSATQWENQHWCSRRCGAWNVGLKRGDDPRIDKIASQVSESAKGRPAWNKGLSKETDERVAKYGRSVSLTQTGKPVTESQKRSLEKGRYWSKGLTAESDQRIAERGRRTSEALKGRVCTEHSKRMKELYRKHPEKHPNAVLAQKTRGKGYTYIEKLTAEYLDELGIEYSFNERIGRKWVDFAIHEHGLIVESDGEYWHTDEAAERDRDEYLKERQWNVLHLTGSQIVTDAKGCKSAIMDAIAESREVA